MAKPRAGELWIPRVAFRDAEHRLDLMEERRPVGVRIRNRPWRPAA